MTASRWDALDGVRGIAFLLVYCEHTISPIVKGGHIGVDLFFVLSGFLITTILLREHTATGSINMRRFYLRRALRLLPALYVMTALLMAYFFVTKSPEAFAIAVEDALGILFYYFNWIIVFAPDWAGRTHAFTHLWSLSVEEQFYLVWPALVLLLLSRGAGRWWLLAAIIIGIVGPAVGRLVLFRLPLPMEHYFRTDLRFDNLMWGALGGWLMHFSGVPTGRGGSAVKWLGVLSLLGICVAALYPLLWTGVLNAGGYTVFGLAAAMLIFAAACYPSWIFRAVLEGAVIRWIGRLSYGLYIWHQPILLEVQLRLPSQGMWDRLGLVSLLSILVASASYYALETPFLRLKDRLGRSAKGEAATSAQRASRAVEGTRASPVGT